jgi:NAD-dependent dihydropyrimidine dehydrogenase PreA subunit
MSKEPTFWSSVAQHWQIARTLRRLKIHFDPAKCIGVWQCYDVCPVGCWTPNLQTRVAEFHDEQLCVACGACVLQCPEGAIELSDLI